MAIGTAFRSIILGTLLIGIRGQVTVGEAASCMDATQILFATAESVLNVLDRVESAEARASRILADMTTMQTRLDNILVTHSTTPRAYCVDGVSSLSGPWTGDMTLTLDAGAPGRVSPYVWTGADGTNSASLAYANERWILTVNGIEVATVSIPSGGSAGTYVSNLGVFNGLWEIIDGSTLTRTADVGVRVC